MGEVGGAVLWGLDAQLGVSGAVGDAGGDCGAGGK